MLDFTLPPQPTASDLFNAYRRDYEAALSPCVTCLLDRCPDGEREALSLLLDDYLMTCGSPPYSPVQQRRLGEKVAPIVDRAMNDPAVIASHDQWDAAWRDTPWLTKRWRRLRSGVAIRWMLWRAKRRPAPWE